MRRLKRQRLAFILVFLSITVAAVRSMTVSVPQGPWSGMYSSFPTVWIAVGLAILTLLLLTQHVDVPWSVIFISAILSAIIIVNLSRLWGVPFGVADPYNHLYFVEEEIYNFRRNVYPLFHIFIRTVSQVTGLRIATILGLVGVLASSIGISFLALVQRRLSLSRRTQQLAVISGIPLVAAGLIARPYTLGIVFIPVFIWIVTTKIRRRSVQIILLVIAFGTLWLHPVGFIVGISVVAIGTLLTEVKRRVKLPVVGSPPAAGWARTALIAVLVFTFAAHILLFSGVGGTIINQASDDSSVTTSTHSGTPDSGTSDPVDSGSGGSNADSSGQNPAAVSGQPIPLNTDESIITRIKDNPIEFISRSSVALLMLIVATTVAIRELLRGYFAHITVVLGLAGTLVLGLFLSLDLIGVDIFNIRRIVTFAPLLLFPLLARALQTQNSIRIVIALLVIVSGGATLYQSPTFSGGIQNGATSAQVDSYRWYGDYGNTTLTSARSTFQIGRWVHGTDEVITWADGGWPPSYRSAREAKYPWQVTGRPDNAVVITGWERAQSRYIARETGIQSAVKDLQRFQVTRERVYDNGNVRFYLPSN